ncbi:hypothetical protein K2173_021113 [Erythroxylum novogranatense]|uniref:Protein kinase domain-containing protein n=1 Tax=Erythroxylum novogranatense TaxID=1862640 RepID=A0AAV8TPP4_9ROSI|nr:hypothetical protein K2173_021113 [Erythroxylum novogranatense]
MMLARLNHPNIVGFVDACKKATMWCILTEYTKAGSIRQFLNKRQKGDDLPLRLAVKDLKSDNLLIFRDKSIKIADFGFAIIETKTEGMTPEKGTYRWMAPPFTRKVDVYSFGIVLWELVTGTLPFQNMTPVQAAFVVVNDGARPIIPNDCVPVLGEIMRRCWDAKPELRPPFSKIVKMLEGVETEIMNTIHKACFRFCVAVPYDIGLNIRLWEERTKESVLVLYCLNIFNQMLFSK